MAPCHRLRGLQVGETGHNPIRAGLCLTQQRFHQCLKALFGGVQLVAHPQAEIGGHLIVPAAACVQTACCGADDFLQARFDVHVNVFQRSGKFEGSAFNL